jgi:hypothetical protein
MLGPEATNDRLQYLIALRPRREPPGVGVLALRRKYVDGAIGNTAQIDSTP